LRALLDADISHRARRLADGGLARLFADLHPALSYADGVLTFARDWEHHRDLGGAGLVLMPSVFVWPSLVTGFGPPWQPMIVYPARGIGILWEQPTEAATAALARLLGQGRTTVLLALRTPASTTALAQQLALAPATVSAHLSALRGAGLLTARRNRREVVYQHTAVADALLAANQLGA
jgi:DNA-binding transcriptional ArsR family regulator